MHSCQSIRKLLALIVLVLSLTLTSNSVYASFALPDVAATDADGVAKVKEGMALFKANCASCHEIDKKVIGPALSGVWDRWESEAKLESWVHNPSKFLESGDPYAQVLKSNDITSVMTAFPQLTPEQINSILMYIKNPNAGAPAEAAPAATATADAGGKGNTNWYIWALIGFLVVLAGLLWNITSKLDKTIKEKNGEKVDDTPLGKKIFSKKNTICTIVNRRDFISCKHISWSYGFRTFSRICSRPTNPFLTRTARWTKSN